MGLAGVRSLAETIAHETVAYRKGAQVETRQVGAVEVTEVYAMPPTPPGAQVIDVHFVNVGFTEAACDREAFIADVVEACSGDGAGEYGEVSVDTLRGGPSYLHLGPWLGDQGLALRLLALGEHYDCWQVITPERLGITGEQAAVIAGQGFVMASGWHPESPAG